MGFAVQTLLLEVFPTTRFTTMKSAASTILFALAGPIFVAQAMDDHMMMFQCDTCEDTGYEMDLGTGKWDCDRFSTCKDARLLSSRRAKKEDHGCNLCNEEGYQTKGGYNFNCSCQWDFNKPN